MTKDTKAIIGTIVAAVIAGGGLLGNRIGKVETEVRALRTEVGTDIQTLRTEVGTDIQTLRTELGGRIDRLHDEMQASYHRLDERMRTIERAVIPAAEPAG